MTGSDLKIVLHAPTAGSLERARRNLGNVLQAAPDATVRILVNGDGVAAALDAPDAAADAATLVCPSSLKRIGRTAPAPLTVMDEPGVIALAHFQIQGWQYVRP